MCIGCLERTTKEIEKMLEQGAGRDACSCPYDCVDKKSYKIWLTTLNDLKVITLTKIKKKGQVCIRGWTKLDKFEAVVKTGFKNKLDEYLDYTDDHKETLGSGIYLDTMNFLKRMNDLLQRIEEADEKLEPVP